MSEEIYCPRCKSSQLVTNDKGFSLVKAAAGGVLIGGIGLLGGVIGSKKIRLNCLSCGHSWILKKTKVPKQNNINQSPGPLDKVPVYKNSSTKHISTKYGPNSITTMSEKIVEEQSKSHTMVLTPSKEKEKSNSTKNSHNISDNAVYSVNYSQNNSMSYSSSFGSQENNAFKLIESRIEERLAKLNTLKEKHLISEDDYQKKKKEILAIL